MSLDPTIEDVKKLCLSCRRNAKGERVLFHYNGHGVPRPTANGEVWVFNKSYTQYIPLSVYDLQTWAGTPSIYVFDCSAAGIIVTAFMQVSARALSSRGVLRGEVWVTRDGGMDVFGRVRHPPLVLMVLSLVFSRLLYLGFTGVCGFMQMLAGFVFALGEGGRHGKRSTCPLKIRTRYFIIVVIVWVQRCPTVDVTFLSRTMSCQCARLDFMNVVPALRLGSGV